MTLAEALIKRAAILNSLGIARIDKGENSIAYADQEKALAIIDKEIVTLGGTTTTRVIRIQHSRG